MEGDVQRLYLIEGDVSGDHGAQCIDDGGAGHGRRCIGVAEHLRAGPYPSHTQTTASHVCECSTEQESMVTW